MEITCFFRWYENAIFLVVTVTGRGVDPRYFHFSPSPNRLVLRTPNWMVVLLKAAMKIGKTGEKRVGDCWVRIQSSDSLQHLTVNLRGLSIDFRILLLLSIVHVIFGYAYDPLFVAQYRPISLVTSLWFTTPSPKPQIWDGDLPKPWDEQ